MKKGFTLVELLGTITILGVIMLIVSPIARNIINDSKEELYEVQVSNIKDALKNWVVDNSRLLPENEGETITITLGQLKAGGYVEAELRNPKNNKCFGNDMLLTVTRHQKNYIYNVEDESSTETDTCDEYLKPYIILNGDAIVYVEVGEEYVDLGASAIGTDGVDISSSITTSISGTSDTIDTSVVGNSYTITYTIVEGVNTTSIKRKVIVNDTIPPELIIPDNAVLEKRDISFNVIEGVTATDNSDSSGTSVNITTKSNITFGIPGEYTITYTATDSSGNKTTKKRIVNIKKAYGNAILSSDDECVLKGNTCEPGTLVEVYVNDSTKYNFYVINDDTNELTLIMDRNLGKKIAWYSDLDDTTTESNNLGPITALTYLNSQTFDWSNIPIIEDYTYDGNTGSNGYKKLEIINGVGELTSKDGKIVTELTGISKARLLTYEEATSLAIGCTNRDESCPSWIYGNLSYNNSAEKPYGYWLLTASSSIFNRASLINHLGSIINTGTMNGVIYNGIRPVITLSK